MDIETINSSFSPSREITDPEFFVGRREEIKESIAALSENGSFIAIHGLRGVGKSSIAHQVKQIAEGSIDLPNMLKIWRYLPKKEFNYLTILVQCDHFTLNTKDLIKRIIFGDDKNQSLFEFTTTGDRKLEAIKNTFKAEGSGALFGVKLGGSGQREETYKTTLTDDLIQQFKQLLGIIRKDNQDRTGLLIIIDEFDVLKDKNGFSSIIKTCSDDFVKFAICGIANTITELIEDHTSIGRQIHSIHVDKMPAEEMYGIINRAEHHLRQEITFSEGATHQLIKNAEGFPYFVHLLGKACLMEAFELGLTKIDNDLVGEIKDKISKGRLKTIYEEIYHSAVKESSQRELLLKLFAESESNEIFSESVYADAKSLGITNPSQLMKELTTPQDNSIGVLTKVREQYYRFTDPVFKVYAKIRSWKFEAKK